MSALGVVIVALALALAGVFGLGWSLGKGERRDRRARIADMQAVLDRTSRDHERDDAALHSAGPFPVGAGYIALSEIAQGWDNLEREQRGWPAIDGWVSPQRDELWP